MFGIRHIDVGNDIDNSAVRFFGQTFVLAAVARFHMENGDMKPLCGDCRKAGISIPEDEHCIGRNFRNKLIRTVYNIPDSRPEVVAYGVHIDFGRVEFQILEKHAVQVIIVILTGMSKQAVEILPAFFYDCGKPYNFRAGSDDDKQFEPAVVFEFYIGIIKFHRAFPPLFQSMYRGATGRNSRLPT